MAAHQAPPPLGSSRQEHWNGLSFPSPMHESEKWKWSCSVVYDSSRPHGLQPTRLLRPWDSPGKSTGVGCRCLLQNANKQAQIVIRADKTGFPGGSVLKESACQCRRLGFSHRRCEFDLWVRKIPWRRKWQPAPVFLVGRSHGQRKLVAYSPWGLKESDMTEWLNSKS